MSKQQPKKNNRNLLLTYAGFGFQLVLSLGLSVYAGLWIDRRLKINMPLIVWILPLLIMSAMIYKVIKDTSKKE